jgi:hypothetical protein
MKFRSDEHEDAYNDFLRRCKGHANDPYYKSLFYLIALSDTTRANVADIFDFKELCIKPEMFHKPWQTGSTQKLTHLAANLFTDSTASDEDDPEAFSAAEIFSDGEYSPYYYEAIKIRYERV